MPILLWPFPTGAAPPPTPGILRRRPSTGKVLEIDTIPGYIFGEPVYVNEPISLVMYLGPGLSAPGTRVLFTFTRPDGSLHLGNPDFAYIGSVTITQNLIPDFRFGQYVVYNFDRNELNQAGTWQVQVTTAGYISSVYKFSVTVPQPDIDP